MCMYIYIYTIIIAIVIIMIILIIVIVIITIIICLYRSGTLRTARSRGSSSPGPRTPNASQTN